MQKRRTLPIGKLFGFELVLDSSWFLIFAFLVWSLTSTFEAWHPSWTFGTVLSVAVVTALSLFFSILVHELAHAIVAKLYGLKVRDITFHMLGGAANIEQEPARPGAELLIAAVGPIASIVLGASMLALARLIGGGSAMATLSPTATLLMWLGPVNLILGAFNLLPGFPMDGGRILRAVLWKATGNRHTATRWSTRVGRAVGLVLIVIGGAMALGVRVPFLGTGFGSGLWLAFIGMFLRGAARSYQTKTDNADALDGLHVEALMRASGAGVPANASLRALVDGQSGRRPDDVLPVFFADRFVGLVALGDIARVPEQAWDECTARQIMRVRENIPVLAPSDRALDAYDTLNASGLAALPVFENDALVGILFERDLRDATQRRHSTGAGSAAASA